MIVKTTVLMPCIANTIQITIMMVIIKVIVAIIKKMVVVSMKIMIIVVAIIIIIQKMQITEAKKIAITKIKHNHTDHGQLTLLCDSLVEAKAKNQKIRLNR